MVKLKSCPCCGGETMLYRRDGMTMAVDFSVICLECGLEFRMQTKPFSNCIFDPSEAVKQIIDKFNRRAKPEREEYENGKTEKAGADCKNA